MLDVQRLLEHYPIIFQNMVEYNDCFWFVCCNFNGLFKMDKNGKTEYLGKLPVEEELYLCSSIACYEGKLYLVLGHLGEILEYDIQRNIFHSYVLPYDHKRVSFYGVGQYQQYMFFWGDSSFDVYRFDMKTKEMKIINISQRLEEMEESIEFSDNMVWKDFMLWKNFCVVDNHLYVPSPVRNLILDINMTEGTVEIHVVSALKGYITICHDGKRFWLSGLENQLVSWDLNTKEIQLYDADHDIALKDAMLSVCNQSIVYFILDNSDEILMADTESMKWRYVQNYRKEYLYKGSSIFTYKTIMLKKLHDKIWILDSMDTSLQTIEDDRRILHDRELLYGIKEFVRDRLHSYFADIRYEAGSYVDFNLEEYIYLISYGEDLKDKSVQDDERVGEKIYYLTAK